MKKRSYLYAVSIATIGLATSAFALGIYEAESASLNAVGTETGVSGYSGSGHSAQLVNSGASITWTINVPSAGSYNLKVRAEAPSSDVMKLERLYVNGVDQKLFRVYSRKGSGYWVQNDLGHVMLNSGNNTIKVEKHEGYTRFDYLMVQGSPAHIDSINMAAPTETRTEHVLEAENAALSPGMVAIHDATFSGTGYTSYFGELERTGDFVLWGIELPEAGTHNIFVRFKNTTSDATKNQKLYINDVDQGQKLLTQVDNTWTIQDLGSYSFTAGSNTIKIESYDGWSQFDYLFLE